MTAIQKPAYAYSARDNLRHTLEVMLAPNDHAKNDLIVKYFDARDMPYSLDGKIVQKHELLRSETLDGAAILREDIVNTINEGAQPATETLDMLYWAYTTKSSSSKVPRGDKNSRGSYAPIVPEGTAIPVSNDRLASAVIPIIKSATIAEITSEMVEDSEYDLITREISNAGARIGNTRQSIALYQLQSVAAQASSESVTSVATLKSAINNEIANLQVKGYIPDRILVTPQAGAALREAFGTGTYQGNDPMMLASVTAAYGVPVFATAIAPATLSGTTYTPGAGTFGGSHGWGVIIYSKPKAVGVAIRNDITFDNPFKDVYKDLTALAVSSRFGASAIHILDEVNNDVNAAVYISY